MTQQSLYEHKQHHVCASLHQQQKQKQKKMKKIGFQLPIRFESVMRRKL